MKKELELGLQEVSHCFSQFISPKQTERSLYLLQGIIESQTVNLWSCAESLGRKSDCLYTKEQLYSQYLDHFQTGNFDKLLKVYFLAVFYQTFPFAKGQLVMDRTEWKFGKRWHNLLVIGFICHDTLVPLVWTDLGERKSSSEAERTKLLDRFLAWWRATGVPMPPFMLYADREFIGSDWFKALIQRQIAFVIRLKENQSFGVWQNDKMSHKTYNIRTIARYLKWQGQSHIEIVVADELVLPFTYAEQTLENGEIVNWLLAANIEDPENAAQYYAQRWTIEDTFGHLKSKGLNLEDFNLDGHHKLEIMMGLVVIAFALAVRQALNTTKQEQIPVKKYKKNKVYPAKATFKRGWEAIRETISNVKQLISLFLDIIQNVRKVYKSKIYTLNNSIVQ